MKFPTSKIDQIFRTTEYPAVAEKKNPKVSLLGVSTIKNPIWVGASTIINHNLISLFVLFTCTSPL